MTTELHQAFWHKISNQKWVMFFYICNKETIDFLSTTFKTNYQIVRNQEVCQCQVLVSFQIKIYPWHCWLECDLAELFWKTAMHYCVKSKVLCILASQYAAPMKGAHPSIFFFQLQRARSNSKNFWQRNANANNCGAVWPPRGVVKSGSHISSMES